ncbi:serine protease snake-like [Malaya genurostris]|uniref:serine protease snake-like n=1 Tax=Malaya genurostris TaxID=325434 RepID=UPI0026F3AF43|nr:serine protease snake-like [Malaya genurostris]XP_058457824.1 serine protease snake-like [Malaya genurostris]
MLLTVVSLSLFLVGSRVTEVVDAQWTAEMKCQGYRNLTVSRTAIIPLIARPVPVFQEMFQCSQTVDVIVGGEEALEGEFPHHALIGWPAEAQRDEEYEFLCGGSLISEQFVVTAAHCGADSARGRPVVVRLGEYDLENELDHQVDFDIAQIVRHPKYRGRTAYHDIALVQLKRKVKFSAFIRPACLWTSNSLNYTTAIASGFGQLGFLMKTARKLNKVSLQLFDSNVCEKSFPRIRKLQNGIIDSQMCVGSFDGRDTCKGDSGGPLQVKTEQQGCLFHLIGIVSWGQDACGYGQSLAIYTKIASYVSWIEQIVWETEVWIWD